MQYQFIDNQKLDNVCTFIARQAEERGIDLAKSSQQELSSFGHEIFDHMLKVYGFTSLPCVQPDSDYSGLGSPEFYRGVRNIVHHRELLTSQTYHTGFGTTNGLYASRARENVAHQYTSAQPSPAITPEMASRVLSFKLSPSTKICKASELMLALDYPVFGPKSDPQIAELTAYLSQKPQIARQMFYKDLAKMAIALNYDALSFDLHGTLAIFNRSKILVSQTEFERICPKSIAEQSLFEPGEN